MLNFLLINELNRKNFKEDIIHSALLLKGARQEQLFGLARKRREEYFPQKKAEVRSVIEISNVCLQNCNFCNINSYSKRKKYTIKHEKLMAIINFLYARGRRVFLLQSGENSSQKYVDFVSRCVRDIRNKFIDSTIILCLGNLNYNQYKQLKDAGAERYILKFETSQPALYKQIKPADSLKKRIKCINMLSDLGFGVGSGNIVGLPGQEREGLVEDLFFIHKLKLTMVSTAVFIPGEDSNYRNEPPGDLNTTLNFMALMRILYPEMLIPSTSSLEKRKQGGQYLGLMAGANTVTIHDGTPENLKKYFPVYSTKRFTPGEKHIRNITLKAGLLL